MSKTIVGLMDSLEEAQKAVAALVSNGFDREDIGLVIQDTDSRAATAQQREHHDVKDDAKGAMKGAGTGAAIGGVAGLVLGIAGLAIPGIGPILAAGPIAATLAGAGVGAVTGGLIGGLVTLGVHEEEAEFYAEGVRRGGFLVTLGCDPDQAPDAVRILRQNGAVDIGKRAAEWRKRGWSVRAGVMLTSDREAQVARHDAGSGGPERLTDLDVQRRGPEGQLDEGFLDPDDGDFQQHFQSYFSQRGEDYSGFKSAYIFGVRRSLTADNRDWEEIEEELRRDWDSNNPGTWGKFKEVIHYGWERETRRH